MPTATQPPAPIPGPNVPFIDPRTGLVTREWYEWLKSIDRLVRGLRDEIP